MTEAATKEYHQTIIAIDKEIEALKDQIANYNQAHSNIEWENTRNIQHVLGKLRSLNLEFLVKSTRLKQLNERECMTNKNVVIMDNNSGKIVFQGKAPCNKFERDPETECKIANCHLDGQVILVWKIDGKWQGWIND